MNNLVLALIALLCVPSLSYADELFMKYGAGIQHSTPAMIASVGGQNTLGLSYFIREWEAGGWHDASRKDSAFGTLGYGLKVENSSLFMSTTVGVAALTSRDELLGGNFQFTEQVCGGVRDNMSISIGLCYRHMSSAGIYSPNIGRDFATVRVSIPLEIL